MMKVYSNKLSVITDEELKFMKVSLIRSYPIRAAQCLKIIRCNGLNLPKLNNWSKLLELRFGITRPIQSKKSYSHPDANIRT